MQRERPHLVCIQETWLNEDEIQIAGYRVVARKDRLKGPKIGYGRVLVLARDDVEFFEELQCDCDGEFNWGTEHTAIGPVLLCNWYRPGDSAEYIFQQLRSSYEQFIGSHIGAFIIGDLNVHNSAWLRYSSGTSKSGRMLHEIAEELGLVQCVRESTHSRGN